MVIYVLWTLRDGKWCFAGVTASESYMKSWLGSTKDRCMTDFLAPTPK